MVSNAIGEWALEEMLLWLREEGESWPVYVDAKNRRYNTDPGERMVLVGWYDAKVNGLELIADTNYALGIELGGEERGTKFATRVPDDGRA